MKTNKLLFGFLAASLFVLPVIAKTAEKEEKANQGKILIAVIDVSTSISNQINQIANVIENEIVNKRLSKGDYFELLSFGNDVCRVSSGQILRTQEDKEPIINALKNLKADSHGTDIGSAMEYAINDIQKLKSESYDLYEPLVLFITDGNISLPPESASPYPDLNSIFNNPKLADKSLYSGWYFIGIQNAGKNLSDLREIAERTGRANELVLLSDMTQFEEMLDNWIKNIPQQKSLEKGQVVFDGVKLNGIKISKDKKTSVADTSSRLTWKLTSTYNKTPVLMTFKDVSAVFQKEDMSIVTIKISPEAGNIEIAPNESHATSATLSPSSKLSGKGHLKISFATVINGSDVLINEEYGVNFMSPGALFVAKWLPPILGLLLLIALIILLKFLLELRPVKVVMETIGKGEKSRPVTMKIGKSEVFGSRAGIKFQLNKTQFISEVGCLERKTKSAWAIIVSDKTAFVDLKNLENYTMSSPIKLLSKDGATITIRFKIQH